MRNRLGGSQKGPACTLAAAKPPPRLCFLPSAGLEIPCFRRKSSEKGPSTKGGVNPLRQHSGADGVVSPRCGERVCAYGIVLWLRRSVSACRIRLWLRRAGVCL